MNSSQQHQKDLIMSYSLHPLISQLNMDLLNQKPYNPLKFIKLWATKKLKQLYLQDEDQSEQQQLEMQFKSVIDQRLLIKNNTNINQNKSSNIKRRNAIFFYHSNSQQNRKQIPKSQQAKSRIMISLKNDIFLKGLSWDQISSFVQKGQLFQTQQQNAIIQSIGEPMKNYFIIIFGEVARKNRLNQQVQTHYSGESFCHESFINPQLSSFCYVCRQQKTMLFCLSGSLITTQLQEIYNKKFIFYQKSLMSKEQFSYLNSEQKIKMINCFKQRRQIMEGQIVLKESYENDPQSQKIFYLILKGKFSKCKKNLSGELMTIKSLKEGDFFGQENLLSNSEIDYIVICLQDNSEIAYINKDVLQQSIDSYERIMKRGKMQIRSSRN